MKQSEALDMITKIQLAHQAMESAWKRVDELKEENKNLKEALAKQEQDEKRKLLPRCFADYQPNHTHDRKCEWCAVNTECQTGEQPKQEQGEPVTLLPDGSAFGVMSFPLPDDHWIYAPNEYRDGEYEPIDLPKPILTHALRNKVVAAVRYAVRSATMRGQEQYFDPDALVQNAVYALCGPYTTPQQRKPLTDEQRAEIVKNNTVEGYHGDYYLAFDIIDDVEAAHGIKE
jgi:hypothetical protein